MDRVRDGRSRSAMAPLTRIPADRALHHAPPTPLPTGRLASRENGFGPQTNGKGGHGAPAGEHKENAQGGGGGGGARGGPRGGGGERGGHCPGGVPQGGPAPAVRAAGCRAATGPVSSCRPRGRSRV